MEIYSSMMSMFNCSYLKLEFPATKQTKSNAKKIGAKKIIQLFAAPIWCRATQTVWNHLRVGDLGTLLERVFESKINYLPSYVNIRPATILQQTTCAQNQATNLNRQRI